MPDVNKRLINPTTLTTTTAVLYTAGAGVTAVVRNIHVCSLVSSIQTFTMTLNNPASGSAGAVYYQYPIPGFGAFDWSGNLVLNPTDYLAALCSANTSLVITISGVEST